MQLTLTSPEREVRQMLYLPRPTSSGGTAEAVGQTPPQLRPGTYTVAAQLIANGLGQVPGSAIGCTGSGGDLAGRRQRRDVVAVRRLAERRSEGGERRDVDVAHPERDLLQARDANALAVLQHLDELRRLEQRVVRAGVEPRHPPPELDQPRAPPAFT